MSSSVNSLALRNIWKNSWPFLAGSSGLSMGRWPRRDLNLFAPLERVYLVLEEGVLEGDSGLIDEHLEGLETAEGAARLGVVAEEQGDRLAMGEQREQSHGGRAEAPDLAHQVLAPAPVGQGSDERLVGDDHVEEDGRLGERDENVTREQVQGLLARSGSEPPEAPGLPVLDQEQHAALEELPRHPHHEHGDLRRVVRAAQLLEPLLQDCELPGQILRRRSRRLRR